MRKILIPLVFMILLVVVGLLVGSNVMTAQANLVQSRALETMAVSQTVSQLFTGVLVIGAGVFGSLLTLTGQKAVRLLRKSEPEQPRWVSGPNANWRQAPKPQTQLRVPPPRQQAVYPIQPAYFQIEAPPQQTQYVEVEEVEQPLGFGGW